MLLNKDYQTPVGTCDDFDSPSAMSTLTTTVVFRSQHSCGHRFNRNRARVERESQI